MFTQETYINIDSMLSMFYNVFMDHKQATSQNTPQDPLSLFTFAIFRINGLMLRNGNRISNAVGQSSARWQVLGRVGFTSQTVADIARDMGHARQSVQRIADTLHKEHLVKYVTNPRDKRAHLLEVTPQGEAVLAKLYDLNDAWTQKIMEKLDPEELLQLTDSLHKVSDVIEQEENANAKKEKI